MKLTRKRVANSIWALFLVVCMFMSSGFSTIGSYIVNGIIVNAEGIKVIKIHYYREDGQYSDWDVWAWADGMDGTGYALIDNGDSKGAVATITMSESNSIIGFIIRKTDWSEMDVAFDRFLSIDSQSMEIDVFDLYCKSKENDFDVNKNGEIYSNIISTGNCGESVRYELNGSGTLIISGFGDMEDYYKGSPFHNSFRIKKIIIKDGVKSIGQCAFCSCKYLETVVISDSVARICDDAFNDCINLENIIIPNNVKSIDGGAFNGCTGLIEITIPVSVIEIGWCTFCYCSNLKDVYYSGTEEEWKNINIDSENECLTNANIHFNSMGDEEDGVTISFRSDASEDMKLSHNFYYSDNLFEQKSTVFNQKLAILTLGMVMSGFSSGESDKYWSVGRDTTNDETAIKTAEKSRVENISHTYNLLGFDKSSIEYYNYDVSLNDASDKVAFSIASKKIHVNGANKTLVAVILRGGGYGSEWSSNFNMGNNGLYHEAFNNAAWEVADKVIDYLSRKKLTQNVKILMGGFSRAAATANLATAKLDKLSNSNKLYSISRDDIYTYTFATPQGIVDNKQNDIHNSLYNNIFNIVNPTDIVPTVALSKWGFGRYGISLTLPYVTAKSSKAANVTKKYNQLTHQKADILQAFKVYKSGINDMDDILYKIAQNTDIFVEEKYQAVITKVLQFLYYDNNASKSVLTLQDIEKAIKNIYPNDYEMIFTNLYIYTTSSIITDLVNPESKLMIATILSIIDVETGSPERFTKDTIKKLPIAEILICGVIVPFGNLMSSDFVSFLISISSRIDYVSKVVDSVLNVGFNHYPELYLSWLESYEAKELFGKKTYKKITASCPVNIDVYSDNGELLASIVNNEIIKDEIPIYLENDSKEIWLTDGDKYDIKITAYDNGTMTYSIEEYDQDFEMQNKTNFYDVPLKKDKVFETAVSSSVGESVTLYDKGSKKIIHPSETLTKDDEEIEISVSCDSNGHVYGNQNVVKGEYVSVTAVPNDGYVFKGWFKENKLVSKDLEYYFNAIENVNLVAKFEKVQFIVGDTNSDGNADIADALMVARYDAGLIQLDENQCSVSDVNQDDIVDIADALMIARYDAGLINSLI